MIGLPRCEECGTELDAGAAEGLCRRCLISMGLRWAGYLEDSPAEPKSTERTAKAKARQFGDYELLEEVARGGMGIVYKARQVSLNRIVALKMLLFGEFSSDEFVRRFQAEAEAAASLQHPNIVSIHEYGEHAGQHYFSMDYIEGKSLSEVVKRGPLTARGAAMVLKRIADAMDYAHQRGILHRDLKPSNIVIDLQGEPRITDFGLAKRLRVDSQITDDGSALGTPNYCAPEQAAGRSTEVGPASDVYALGAILYYVLTERPPFVAETIQETLQLVLNTYPVAPHSLNPSVPRDLETICLRCLEKDRAARYASAGELAQDLQRWLSNQPILARPVGIVGKTLRWCRREPAIASLVAAVGLLLLGSAIGSTVMLAREAKVRREQQQVADVLGQTILTLPRVLAMQNNRDALVQTVQGISEMVATNLQDKPQLYVNVGTRIAQAYHEAGLFQPMEEMARGIVKVSRKELDETALDRALRLLGDPLMHLDKLEEAEAIGCEALALQWKLKKDDTALVACLNLVGVVLQRHGKADKAEELFLEALSINRKNHRNENAEGIGFIENLALGWWFQEKFHDAAALEREVLAMRRRLPHQDEQEIATAQHNLARALCDQGCLDEAEDLYCEALATRRLLLGGDDHPAVATTLRNYGRLRQKQGRIDEAAAMYRQALAIRRKFLPPKHQYLLESIRDVEEIEHDLATTSPPAQIQSRALLKASP